METQKFAIHGQTVAASAGMDQLRIPTQRAASPGMLQRALWFPGKSLRDLAHHTNTEAHRKHCFIDCICQHIEECKGFFFISNGPWSQCVLKHTLYLNRMKIMADRAIPRQHK